METRNNTPIHLFKSQSKWEHWLETHCENRQGIWLKIAKKNSNKISMRYFDALETALCYGWIDTLKGSYDTDYYIQKFTPRQEKSSWSKTNVERIKQLTAEGKMRPSGVRSVENAKRIGLWDTAYDSDQKRNH